MTGIGELVIHVSDIDQTADFWAEVLAPAYRVSYRDHNSATFSPVAKDGLTLQFNTVDQTHLDLTTNNEEERAAETERLLALGAERVDWPHRDITVLDAPGGLRFCVL